MSTAPARLDALVLHLGPVLQKLSEDEFFALCQLNRDLRIERTGNGDLIIMPPTGSETGGQNFKLIQLLGAWVEKDGSGRGFDSSTGFRLANGATRSPDVSWVRSSRWQTLTKKQRQKFAPLCPDFVAEIRSPSDSLEVLQATMDEYIANGALLGWLIDPVEKKVYVYRPASKVTCLAKPKTVSGDPVLPGFVLDLDRIW